MKDLVKQFLSFFYEIPVEEVTSSLHGSLEVCWSSGRKVLHSKESNYSYGSLHHVLQRAMKASGLRQHPPQNALILGLGAGSAVHILQKEWKLHTAITGVEKDPEVLRLARKHFGLVPGPLLQIFEEDATDFVASCQDVFDLILVDLFIGNKVPEAFGSLAFWDHLEKLCSTGGRVLFNTLVFDSYSQAQADQIEEAAAQRFPVSGSLIIPGRWDNRVIFAEKTV